MVGGASGADTPANYCKNMMQVGMARAAQDEKQFSAFATPVPDEGNNLFTFLAARLSASWENLGCGALLNAPDPVNLTLDANGVATAATFSPLAIGTLPGGVAPTATASGTRHGHADRDRHGHTDDRDRHRPAPGSTASPRPDRHHRPGRPPRSRRPAPTPTGG